MATRKTVDKIQIKRGSGTTLSDNQNTTVLDVGEPFYHVNTGRVYIGNGENRISELPYMSAKNGVALGSNGTFVGDSGVSIGENTSVSDYGYSIGKDSYVEQGGISIGGNTRSFNHGISIGENASVDAISSDAISIGHGALSDGSNGISIGANSVSAEGGVAIGANASQTSASICIGENSSSVRTNCIAIGNSAKVTNISGDPNENALAIGTGAEAMSGSSIAIGRTCRAGGDGTSQVGNSCIAVGEDANSCGEASIAIGAGSNCWGTNSISVGANSHSGHVVKDEYGNKTYVGANNISIGNGCVSSEEMGIAIGTNCRATTNSVAIGRDVSAKDGDIIIGNLGVANADIRLSLDGTNAPSISIMKSGPNIIGASYEYSAIGVSKNYGVHIGCRYIKDFYPGSKYDVSIGTNAFTDNTVKIRIGDINRSYSSSEVYFGATRVSDILSDRRLKTDIHLADTSRCLSDVNRLAVHRFMYLPCAREDDDVTTTGWIADEVAEVFPHAVHTAETVRFIEKDFDGNTIYEESVGANGEIVKCPKEVEYSDVQSISMTRIGLPTLWGAVQELSKLMNATQERVTELETSVKTLKKENTLLKKKLKELDTSTKEEPSIEE